MGKPRLAPEAMEDRRRASTELWAGAPPRAATAAFGRWVEALERHLRPLGKAEVAVLCGGFLDDLASLLRSVAVVRGAAPDREPPRPRLLEGLAVLLANLAEQAPVVVVLDDVHLADASSWDALHYLAGSLSTERVLVVASARPGELAEHTVAQRVLLDLEQVGALHRVDIGPLPADAVRELAEEGIGGARGVALQRQVGRVLLPMGRPGEPAPPFARSADVGDAEALAVLSNALHQAEERGVYGEALGILAALVALLPAGDRRWV